MTLLEVIKSGLTFKRADDKEIYYVNEQGWIINTDMRGLSYTLPITVENLTAEDWVIYEE